MKTDINYQMAVYRGWIAHLRCLRPDLTESVIVEEIQKLARTTVFPIKHHLRRSIRLAEEARPMQWEPAGNKAELDMRHFEAVEDFAKR